MVVLTLPKRLCRSVTGQVKAAAICAIAVFTMVSTPLSAAEVTGVATVIDGDTLDIGDVRIRLNGIDAPEAGQRCSDGGSTTWRCGKAATSELERLADGKPVQCTVHVPDDGMDRMVATCFVDGRDIGEQMMLAGLAWAFVKYSREYVEQEKVAKVTRLGIWRSPTQPAWKYREERWIVAKQTAPEGCPIKGNIRGNNKIYHVPWSSSYVETGINESRGERWFCSEEEAIAAGWRAPKRR